MIDKQIVLGIVPARKGSKGIPNKNIRILADKPLIVWTIDAALKAKTLDKTIVSTDDKKIAEISRKYGAEVPFIRPKVLARDSTPTLLALQHAVRYLEKKEDYSPDIIVTLQPTSPLRDETDIDKAVHRLMDTGADSVVSVCEVEYSPYWMKKLKKDKVYPFVKTKKEYERRQDLPKVYRVNGAVYVTRRNVLMKDGKVLGKDTRALIMPLEKSIDIDTMLDFKLAELLIKEGKT